ncbi:DinB family protein [Aquirufa rosea]|uniref:DUF1569 domain-containing protein n=1 Tax=Aquirufa rosea TaxID=2509241 RepID=A0A4Q1BZE1_9BACT|nr:DinB family protein [Aquirufa rosea]RXK48932.1 hypothetical protein ESB04_08245 [Aquirufa rosea]
MESLERQVQVLEKNMALAHITNPLISEGSVGWHIEHCLMVMITIISALKKSDPSTYHWMFNARRAWVFLTQRVPRGRVKAPSFVQPQGEINLDEIRAKIAKVYQSLEEANALPPNTHFRHFIFGVLDLKDSLYFLRIHTHHHLKIIQDLIDDNFKTRN